MAKNDWVDGETVYAVDLNSYGDEINLANDLLNGATELPTGEALVKWDGDANLYAESFIPGFSSTTSSASTTTIDPTLPQIHVVTGSTTHIMQFSSSGYVAGMHNTIINKSTGLVTVKSSNGDTIIVLDTNVSAKFIALQSSPSTSAHWLGRVSATSSLSGTYSSIPSASIPGRIYVCTDVGLILRDTGSSWVIIWTGPLLSSTPPMSTGWSWLNQGGASVATELGGERITAPSGTRNWRLRTRSLSPTSNYTATAYVELSCPSVAGSSPFVGSGICIRDSSSGFFVTFGPNVYVYNTYSAYLAVHRWSSVTTVNSELWTRNAYHLSEGRMPNLIRIRDDGTNRYFEYSFNGIDWPLAYSESRTAYITPNQFAYGITNDNTGSDAKFRMRSLTGIS